MMRLIRVRHRTVYRYRTPVRLGEHRMMFRPRASHDLRLIRTGLTIDPEPSQLRWLHDPFDNSVAVATFEGTTSTLCFDSTVTLEHYESVLPEYLLEHHARSYPFNYAAEDLPSLVRPLSHHYPSERVAQWALQFLGAADRSDTVEVLRAMTGGIRQQIAYTRRLEKGVQSPDETLSRRQGSCRDLAVLMIEGVRSLGIAARFVSGYILAPDSSGTIGGGATHAWMQAYLPGAGWIDFDPTNSIIGNRNLIRVAVAWSPEHVLPLSGTFEGDPGVCLGMEVDVAVNEATE